VLQYFLSKKRNLTAKELKEPEYIQQIENKSLRKVNKLGLGLLTSTEKHP